MLVSALGVVNGMRQRRSAVKVRAEWDDEAGVWVAEGANLPGLVTEAETVERLLEKLRSMVPDLLAYSPDLAAGFLPEIRVTLVRRDTIELVAA
ncbi:MAG TPA: DUF1902 domain-containing protein [Stellaceae bacterium]|nr:DUF1902 domain-containing protein [Stellaceae bacterium]